jgi:ribonuclease P protein component
MVSVPVWQPLVDATSSKPVASRAALASPPKSVRPIRSVAGFASFPGLVMTRSVPREPVSRRIDFEVLGQARRASEGFVSVSFAPSSTRSEVAALERSDPLSVRVAYSVSRHTGGAVVRNRVRRRFRAIMTELALEPGLYMVRPRNGITEASFLALRADLLAACARLGALQSEGQLSVAQNTPNARGALDSLGPHGAPAPTGVFE